MSQIPTVNPFYPTFVKQVMDFLKSPEDWDVTGDVAAFKVTLPETRLQDLDFEIVEDGKRLKISKVLPAGIGDGDEVANGVLMECGIGSDGKISRSFNLPRGLNLNDFKTAMEDGVFTVAFTKLRKKKFISKVWGVLAKAAPVCFLIGIKIASETDKTDVN